MSAAREGSLFRVEPDGNLIWNAFWVIVMAVSLLSSVKVFISNCRLLMSQVNFYDSSSTNFIA
jgi:hypothetical protein